MAAYFNIKNVFCYSGGTEATALFPVAAETLKNTGFKIEKLSNEDNPVQCYRYECFKTDGTSQLCSIHYADQEEANAFIWSLEPLYHQQYAIDHKL